MPISAQDEKALNVIRNEASRTGNEWVLLSSDLIPDSMIAPESLGAWHHRMQTSQALQYKEEEIYVVRVLP